MSVYLFSLYSPDAAQKYVMDRVETTTRSLLTEDAFLEEFEKLKKKHHLLDAVLINVFKLDDEAAEEVEAIMEGDCTQCGHIDPEGTPPYQCQIHGMTQNGGCNLWCPKGVVEDD